MEAASEQVISTLCSPFLQICGMHIYFTHLRTQTKLFFSKKSSILTGLSECQSGVDNITKKSTNLPVAINLQRGEKVKEVKNVIYFKRLQAT